MRLFLAIDIPEETKQQIWFTLEPMRFTYRNLNWTPFENYHITVQFFGEAPEENLSDLKDRLEQCLFEATPFDVQLRTGGVFIKNTIALYIDCYRQKKLETIVKAVRDDLGVKGPLTYTPHITIARYKIPSKQQYLLLKKKCQNLSFTQQFHVDAVSLYQSILKPSHAEYRPIHTFRLSEDLR